MFYIASEAHETLVNVRLLYLRRYHVGKQRLMHQRSLNDLLTTLPTEWPGIPNMAFYTCLVENHDWNQLSHDTVPVSR